MKRPTPNFTWEDLQREKEAHLLKLEEMKQALKEHMRRERARYILRQLSSMKRGPKPPPKSFTVQDYAENFKMNINAAGVAIHKLMDMGLVKRLEYRAYYIAVPGGLEKCASRNSNASGGPRRTLKTKK